MRPPEELQAKVLKPGEKLTNSGSILVGDKAILYSPNDYGEEARIFDTKGVKIERKVAGNAARALGVEGLPRRPRHEMGMGRGNQVRQAIVCLFQLRHCRHARRDGAVGQRRRPRPAKKLEFDGPSLAFTNDAEADKLLRRTYRKGCGNCKGGTCTV